MHTLQNGFQAAQRGCEMSSVFCFSPEGKRKQGGGDKHRFPLLHLAAKRALTRQPAVCNLNGNIIIPPVAL